MAVNFEIERKYLIYMPDSNLLEQSAEMTEITQTYLLSEKGTTARVRKRGTDGKYTYTHTEKRRVNDIKRVETEREISPEEYRQYLQSADPGRNVIYKKRFCILYEGQLFEIDVYPFWTDRAIMEIEMEHEQQSVKLPPFVKLIREVSGDRRYTNASLAKEVPTELI